MKSLMTVLIASAFAVGSSVALAQAIPDTSTPATSDQAVQTVQQQRNEAFDQQEHLLQQDSRSSASGPAYTTNERNARGADKVIRSGDKAKDFAEWERAASEASQR